jgi:hypothetical protein
MEEQGDQEQRAEAGDRSRPVQAGRSAEQVETSRTIIGHANRLKTPSLTYGDMVSALNAADADIRSRRADI